MSATIDPYFSGPEAQKLSDLLEKATRQLLQSRTAVAAVRVLSPMFLGRMQRFVFGLPGWDGEPILQPTASRAAEIAELTLQVAPEPFAAPAMDGSILLKWDLSPDISVEFYVEDIESWDTAAVIHSGTVKEVPIADRAALLALLRSLMTQHAGR